MTYKIDSPQVEVGLLGTQDKYVALLEQGIDVAGDQLKITGEDEDVHLTVAVLDQLG